MSSRTIPIFLSAMLIMLTPFISPCHAFELSSLDELLYPKSEKTISMDFIKADLNTVLKLFSQQSGLNFIAATDIASKTVNLYLDNVPVEEALERILSANNLSYEIEPGSNIFVVNEMETSDKQLMTRIYPLKFATVPSSKLNSTLSSDDDGGGSQDDDDESSGIIGAIEGILTDSGSVVEDIRTNSIIVSDIPSQFPLIEQTISKLDVRIPQILIEAELLDISKNTADLLGAKFGSTPVTFTGAERDTLYPFDRNKIFNNVGKSGGQGFTFNENEYRVGTLSFAGLTIALDFLRTQTDTKNLARPRILTVNNSTAEIFISTDEAIGLASSTTASEGTSTSVAQAERVQTGVFLKVTPQANVYTREITMAIEPKVIQARAGGTFGGTTFKDPEERGSKSILRVHDGDTIVLGGLLRSDIVDTKTRVPILGKIPILGAPFRHTNKTESQRELIIFITPHILEDNMISNTASSRRTSITREQSIPEDRRSVIEQALSSIEKTKFNSYK